MGMKTASERLKEVLLNTRLTTVKKNKGIYDHQIVDGETYITPVHPIKPIKIDRNFVYNKNLAFADLVKAMSDA